MWQSNTERILYPTLQWTDFSSEHSDPSALYTLRLQPHNPLSLLVKADNIVLCPCFSSVNPIYPGFPIPGLLHRLQHFLVLSSWIELLRSYRRHIRLYTHKLSKFIYIIQPRQRAFVFATTMKLDLTYSHLAYSSLSISDSLAQTARLLPMCSIAPPFVAQLALRYRLPL